MMKKHLTKWQRQIIVKWNFPNYIIVALVLSLLAALFSGYINASAAQVSIQGQVWERRSCADGYVVATGKTVKLFEVNTEVGITSTSGNGFFAFTNVVGNKIYKLQVLHGTQPVKHIFVPLNGVVEATFFINLVQCNELFLPLITYPQKVNHD